MLLEDKSRTGPDQTWMINLDGQTSGASDIVDDIIPKSLPKVHRYAQNMEAWRYVCQNPRGASLSLH